MSEFNPYSAITMTKESHLTCTHCGTISDAREGFSIIYFYLSWGAGEKTEVYCPQCRLSYINLHERAW